MNLKHIKINVTADGFVQLTYSGYDRWGDEYDVMHEAPVTQYGRVETVCSAVEDLFRTVMAEARVLYAGS